MNERIRDLLDEALGSIDPMDQDANVFEKFAELIIKECIKLSQPPGEYPVDDTWIAKSYWEGCYDSSERIKEHFGVEESVNAELKHKCSVCGTTENVEWVGGYQPYLCDSPDCIPF